MRTHDSDAHRCPACRLHLNLCLCPLIPCIATRTRLVLVQHQLELRKPTNTGRLALRCLPNSTVVVRGADSIREIPDAWATATRPVVLYPARDARPIDEWRDSPEPVTLIVLDGTWSQAARARRRIPGLAALPCARLPEVAPSMYRLRHAARPGRLSTLEAIARALGILEGAEVEAPLAHILRVMVDRTLWTNGRIKTEEVTGGIPPGVQSHRPAG